MATRECPVSQLWRLTPSPQYGTIPRGSNQLSGWQVAYTGSLSSWEGQCWVYLLLLFVYFWLCCMTCSIFVPQPGIEPEPQQWKHQILTTGLPGSSWMVNVLWSALNSAYWECLFSSLYSKALDITLWDIFNFLLPSFDHTWREKMPFKQFPKSFPAQRPVYILNNFNPVWKHLYNILKKLYGLSLCLILSNPIF